MPFLILLLCVAILAGMIAAMAGFGIGSLMTPLLAVELGTKLAVALVSVPHFAGTLLRFWMLREHVNRKILIGFGLLSAFGGLLGALLHAWANSPALAVLLGILLIFAGSLNLTGYHSRLRFGPRWAWLAGLSSGLFGGLVGNQGGIRSAALLNLGLDRNTFVATATAIALLVDLARMPVYLAMSAEELAQNWELLAVPTTGVIVGTLLGKPLLSRVPEVVFRRLVAGLILALGIWMLIQAAGAIESR